MSKPVVVLHGLIITWFSIDISSVSMHCASALPLVAEWTSESQIHRREGAHCLHINVDGTRDSILISPSRTYSSVDISLVLVRSHRCRDLWVGAAAALKLRCASKQCCCASLTGKSARSGLR